MNRIKQILALFVFVILFNGCTDSIKSESGIIADDITVSYETSAQITPNEDLVFWIKNQTDFCIVFPPDYGIKIFSETSNGWKQVSNLVNYLGTEPRLLQPKEDFSSEDSVFARPDVTGLVLVKPTNFYVSISGNLCDDNTVLIEKKIPFTVTP